MCVRQQFIQSKTLELFHDLQYIEFYGGCCQLCFQLSLLQDHSFLLGRTALIQVENIEDAYGLNSCVWILVFMMGHVRTPVLQIVNQVSLDNQMISASSAVAGFE